MYFPAMALMCRTFEVKVMMALASTFSQRMPLCISLLISGFEEKKSGLFNKC
jgi:hypothetical protein